MLPLLIFRMTASRVEQHDPVKRKKLEQYAEFLSMNEGKPIARAAELIHTHALDAHELSTTILCLLVES